MKRLARTGIGALACAAHAAQAHALQERYELPVPLALVVAGGCAAVVLTFALAAFFARARAGAGLARAQHEIALSPGILGVLRALSVGVLALTIATALWGTQDPLMNLAPTLVWIVAWLGFTFASALAVDLWPALDPWRGLHAALGVRSKGADKDNRTIGWPRLLGCWPAVALLLAWSWLEVVYPIATSPRRMGWLLLAWTAVSLGGMGLFGRRAWQAHADAFALAFATFGRMPRWRLALAGADAEQPAAGRVAFVIALLATVIFDGLHGAPAWNGFEAGLRALSPVPLDINGYVAGTSGLLVVWLLFVVLFEGTLRLTFALLQAGALRAALRVRLALTLLPIAAGYVVAHNFSAFLLQGQRVFALLSDPFGRQWDLFGTASFYPDIAWLDARAIWLVAVAAIVTGHAASIWWSHRVVLAAGFAPRRTAIALAPLALLMVGYTAVSLLLLATGD